MIRPIFLYLYDRYSQKNDLKVYQYTFSNLKFLTQFDLFSYNNHIQHNQSNQF
jgi:hypothetical protein